MNSPSVDIKDMLEGESFLELTLGTNLFISREPAEPDNCVTIFDTGGNPQMRLDSDTETTHYEYQNVNIRVRNETYLAGWSLANSIMNQLHGRAQETWNDTLYTAIQCVSGPAAIGWDENNRILITLNFRLQRR